MAAGAVCDDGGCAGCWTVSSAGYGIHCDGVISAWLQAANGGGRLCTWHSELLARAALSCRIKYINSYQCFIYIVWDIRNFYCSPREVKFSHTNAHTGLFVFDPVVAHWNSRSFPGDGEAVRGG